MQEPHLLVTYTATLVLCISLAYQTLVIVYEKTIVLTIIESGI